MKLRLDIERQGICSCHWTRSAADIDRLSSLGLPL